MAMACFILSSGATSCSETPSSWASTLERTASGRESPPTIPSARKLLAGAFLGSCLVTRLRHRRVLGRVRASTPAVDSLMIEPDQCEELIASSRPAHWVVRTSNLEAVLNFLSTVFGMKVLRHEEFDHPCAITCNGVHKTPWSKTMVGYGPEDESYCLELTYNYGVADYGEGSALDHICVGVHDLQASLEAASGAGYSVQGEMIFGPDGYRFRAVAQPDRKERFQYIALKVASLPKAVAFYTDALGMKDLSSDFLQVTRAVEGQTRAVGYKADQVPLLLCESDGGKRIMPGDWDGRNAITIPGRSLRAAYKRIERKGHGGKVLHPIREFNEAPALRRMRGLPPMACQPPPEEYLQALRKDPSSAPPMGTLAVAIVTDADGFEICLVSKETYDIAVARAYKPECNIDWEWRKEALAGRRTPTPDHMLACV
eukprot:TRINITY_DN41238_c0_g1_i1.p1 TRINITY_DN41238_c0_g1~~TRINITY_DN41238_c0_g1_i1.p1  ORF type:complete len:429 (-),score=56.49 TRINITY_DN41238_c0_g1_i1:78-1364(-)